MFRDGHRDGFGGCWVSFFLHQDIENTIGTVIEFENVAMDIGQGQVEKDVPWVTRQFVSSSRLYIRSSSFLI